MARTNTLNNGAATVGFESKLWAAADALRNNMDAAEYKHVVLGLIFLKYLRRLRGEARRPPRELVVGFEEAASPVDSRIEVIERESLALAALRDTLLPKLISGELLVRARNNDERERVQA